jgi:hypothetical protein
VPAAFTTIISLVRHTVVVRSVPVVSFLLSFYSSDISVPIDVNQFRREEEKKNLKKSAMVETIEGVCDKIPENFNVPVIFVENRDEEVNGHIIESSNSDHYSPSVRVVHVSKPSNTSSGFGFHLSRSKWDPYPYVSRIDKDSFASSSGLREGDCVLEVCKSF